ncbi:MAG: CPBP family intramembrane metalloprotease [Phycisphaeraceae bacterium]|nr:CPBP family intramembrane metalloprotease [Phycisphaeraceae bacterium]
MPLALVALAPVVLWWLRRRRVIGPGSTTGWRELPKGLLVGEWLLAAVGVWFAILVVAAAAQMALWPDVRSQPPLRAQAQSSLVTYGAGMVLAVLAYRWMFRAPPGVAPAGACPMRSAGAMGMGMLGLVVLYPVLFAAGFVGAMGHQALTGEPPDLIAHSGLADMVASRGDPWVFALVGCAVLGAPVVEEIIFRGLLQTGLGRLMPRRWMAVGVAAGLFALVHAPTVPWHAIGVLAVLGVAMGVAYERRGSILAPIGMHVAFNALNVALAWMQVSSQGV